MLTQNAKELKCLFLGHDWGSWSVSYQEIKTWTADYYAVRRNGWERICVGCGQKEYSDIIPPNVG